MVTRERYTDAGNEWARDGEWGCFRARNDALLKVSRIRSHKFGKVVAEVLRKFYRSSEKCPKCRLTNRLTSDNPTRPRTQFNSRGVFP